MTRGTSEALLAGHRVVAERADPVPLLEAAGRVLGLCVGERGVNVALVTGV